MCELEAKYISLAQIYFNLPKTMTEHFRASLSVKRSVLFFFFFFVHLNGKRQSYWLARTYYRPCFSKSVRANADNLINIHESSSSLILSAFYIVLINIILILPLLLIITIIIIIIIILSVLLLVFFTETLNDQKSTTTTSPKFS